MSENSKERQSVVGFKVVSYAVKKAKSDEKIVLHLEALIDDIGCGEHSVENLLGSLLNHKISNSDVAIGVFMEKKEK